MDAMSSLPPGLVFNQLCKPCSAENNEYCHIDVKLHNLYSMKNDNDIIWTFGV